MNASAEKTNEFELHPYLGEFRNPQIEHSFLQDHLPHSRSQLRIALISCAAFYFLFALTDVAVLGFGREALVLLLARLLVAVAAVAAIEQVYSRPSSTTAPVLAATAVEIIGMGAFMLIAFYRPHEMPWHSMAISIMLTVVYLFIPNRLIYSAAVALASTVIFLLLTVQIGHLKPAELVTVSMLLLLTNAFGGLAAMRYQLLWRKDFHARTILGKLAVRDHLTGCYNRRHLDENILDTEFIRSQRNGLWLTVILCDLDHFKSVNDSFGHQTGDTVIRIFSTLLQQITREHIDYVVRYGGEEFLLVIPGANLAAGTLLAERLRTAIAEMPIPHTAERSIKVTASFGVASINFALDAKTTTQFELVAAADNLLYQAKRAGRNFVASREL